MTLQVQVILVGLYINSVTKTWEDASRSCSLVGSDRPPSYDVNAQEIPVLWSRYQGGKLQAGTLYWIGATATFTPWFELLGREDVILIFYSYWLNIKKDNGVLFLFVYILCRCE